MAPDAELYDYRVFGEESEQNLDADAAVAKSIRAAVDVDKCHVINLSLSVSSPVRPEVKSAVKYAHKKGVHMVCSCGNDGDGYTQTDELESYPASFKETISVAAVRKEDGFPAAAFPTSNSGVIYSGVGVDVTSLKPGGGMQTMSGTSMAAPHITGIIACLLSGEVFSKYTDRQIRMLLDQSYVVDIADQGYDKQTGEGFVTYLAGEKDSMEEINQLLSLVR